MVTAGLQIVACVWMPVDPEAAVLPELKAGACVCFLEQIAGTEELTEVACLLQKAVSGYALVADPAEVEVVSDQKALPIVTEVESDSSSEAEDAAELVRTVRPVADMTLPVVVAEPRTEEEPGLVVVGPCYKVSSGVVALHSGASFGLEPMVEPVFEADYRMAQEMGMLGYLSGAPAEHIVIQPGLLNKAYHTELMLVDMVEDQIASGEE